MVIAQIEVKSSNRLLKHIIKCYNRLTENPRARLALGQNLPEIVAEKNLCEAFGNPATGVAELDSDGDEIKKPQLNLDENSKKCLKNLAEILNQENKK